MSLILPGDIIASLAEIESTFPVNEWTVNGVRAWPLFRGLLSYRASLASGHWETAASRFQRLAKHLGVLWNAFLAPWVDAAANARRTAPAEVFVLTYSAARQAKLSARHVDTILGPILQELRNRNRSSLCWEFSHGEPYRTPRFEPTYLAQRELYLHQLREFLAPTRLEAAHLTGFEDVGRLLDSKGLPFQSLRRERFLSEFAHVLGLSSKFESVLDEVGPKAVFTANAGRYEFALHLACSRRSIPSVEVQHGLQGPTHGQYASWTQAPPEGYELLPFAYWCWDAESAEVINRWSSRCATRHRAIVAGMPWFEECAKMDLSRLDPVLASELAAPKGRKRILMTLQPPDKIYADGRLIPEFVLEALGRMDKEWIWWIRLHPSMKADYPRLEGLFKATGATVDLRAANEIPLFFLLRETDLHVTHSSAVVADARRFGVGSIVWSDLGASLHASAIQEGTCATATTATALADAAAVMMARGKWPVEQPSTARDKALDNLLGGEHRTRPVSKGGQG